MLAEPAVAPDRGGITVFQSSTSHQPPRQVNRVVRQLRRYTLFRSYARNVASLFRTRLRNETLDFASRVRRVVLSKSGVAAQSQSRTAARLIGSVSRLKSTLRQMTMQHIASLLTFGNPILRYAGDHGLPAKQQDCFV
jgi:hypothetical protein